MTIMIHGTKKIGQNYSSLASEMKRSLHSLVLDFFVPLSLRGSHLFLSGERLRLNRASDSTGEPTERSISNGA